MQKRNYSEMDSILLSATKVAMGKKFNDPDNSCNVLVATDAVGMGLNL